MSISRSNALKLLGAGAGSALSYAAPLPGAAQPAKRVLGIDLLGFQLGIHIPATAAAIEGIPAIPGYGPPNVLRIEQVRTLTSNVVAGTGDFGDAEITAALAAAEQGADLKILGYFYRNTSHVFVVNADRIKTYKDLENPDNIVAVNGKGAIEFAMLIGPLIKNGVDVAKVSTAEVGGSGSRMRALLSGRVQAVPIHFEQAAEVLKQGPYKILFEPWTFYKQWVHEVWIARGAWLKNRENARAAVDVMKATQVAFRRANRDFPWFLQMYRKYATLDDAKTITEATLRPIWSKHAVDVKAWPDQNILTAADFKDLLPIYKAAGDLSGTLRINEVVDSSYAEQALKELGKSGL